MEKILKIKKKKKKGKLKNPPYFWKLKILTIKKILKAITKYRYTLTYSEVPSSQTQL